MSPTAVPSTPAEPSSRVPLIRIETCRDAPVDPAGQFVLYHMHAFRRAGWNFSLQRAVDWARALGKPLAVLETLTCGGRWANDRLHRFVLQGMADSAARFERATIAYYPYVESRPGRALELATTLAARACVVVADDFPIREASDAVRQIADGSPVRVEKVDSNGILPIRLADRTFTTAHAFRRFLQRSFRDQLLDFPKADPLARSGLPRLDSWPRDTARRWPAAPKRLLDGDPAELTRLPIDHTVAPVATEGGSRAARRTLKHFLAEKLARYTEDRNHPDDSATSGLAPYLHHGHVSPHEVFSELTRVEGWSPGMLAENASGRREGWWATSASAEAFLDQLLTWREVGFNMCVRRDDYDRYDSLPPWAKQTLADHAADPREVVYSPSELEAARTHDRLWNAAQRELLEHGRMHNYLRMLWGKKILQWSPDPQEALSVMIELNNKYALDGQDPNSYSGIFWVLGRYDRPCGPERPVFGKIRFMSSENTARKLRVRRYLGEA
jgi:deoxyribodipyrimidine photo-lyase